MILKAITLSTLYLSLIVVGSAEMAKEEDSPKMTKKQFLDKFQKPFVTSACKQKGVISRCFKIDTKSCVSSVNSVYAACRKQITKRMPTVVRTYDSRVWGSNLALCVVQKIKTNNEKLFMKNVDRCSGIKKFKKRSSL